MTDPDTTGRPQGQGEIFQPLSRRRIKLASGEDVAPKRIEWLSLPRPSVLRALVCLAAWVSLVSRCVLSGDLRGLRLGEPGPWAQRIAGRLQRLGPYAVKIGQQGAFRFDLLVPDLAIELGRLDDHLPPFPIETAVARVEAAIGAPLDTVFSTFDPTPISSTVIACEYQAQLLDGDMVVVRVRRPGVRKRLAAELFALSTLTSTLELFSLLRPGFAQRLRDETRDLLVEEADFRVHARYHNLFRSRTRRDHIRYATCTRVYRQYLSDRVMVSEFASGVWLGEVIAAARSGNDLTLGRLRAMGIDPKDIARKISQLAWWEIHENLFFHAEPTDRDIVVRPGGQIVFVRFSDCTTASNRLRSLKRELYHRLREDDASGATDVMIQLASPLPFIDTYALSKRIEARLWHYVFALRDRDARPSERASTELWLALFNATRQDGILARVETVQIMRSSMMFDTLVVALDPTFEPLRDFTRFERALNRREARRFRRQLRRTSDHPVDNATATAARVWKLMRRGAFRVEGLVENIPVHTLAMAGKAATTAVATIRAVLLLGGGLVFGATGVSLYHGLTHHPIGMREALSIVGLHPIYLSWSLLVMIVLTRRLLLRLSDTDPD